MSLLVIIYKVEGTRWPRGQCFGVRSRKLSNVEQSLDGWPKIYYLEILRVLEGTLSRWSRLHLQSLALKNPHWACVVGYGSFSLCVLHKEGLCRSSGGINNLMMIYIVSLQSFSLSMHFYLSTCVIDCPRCRFRVIVLIFSYDLCMFIRYLVSIIGVSVEISYSKILYSV
jgi:hypothetical protein